MDDRQGNPVSHTAPDAVAALDSGIALLNAYHGDPVRTVGAALKAHPDFVMGHTFLAALFATAMDKAFAGDTMRALGAAENLIDRANERERAHIAAVRSWVNGDLAGATDIWGAITARWPRDILALQMVQQGEFFQGHSTMLRDRVAAVLPHWNENVPGYGFVLGMHAFGLEEAGEYRAAEAAGRSAVSLNPQDAWAVHAVAHVLEMEGRAEEGDRWIGETAPGWEPDGLLSYHLWWHNGLFHLDRGDPQAALSLFDQKIATGLNQALELVDGAALLWRLHVLGHDTADRWRVLADKWEEKVEDGFYAFNDAHAAMAFAATGRGAAMERLHAAARRAAAGAGTNAMMAREVGLPAIEGFAAFGRGHYGEAVHHLMPLPAKAHLFGGSHAQRDVIDWTMVEAAIRAGNRAVAERLAAERLAEKPQSPVNRSWATRAAELAA
jgi:hypothetical protein